MGGAKKLGFCERKIWGRGFLVAEGRTHHHPAKVLSDISELLRCHGCRRTGGGPEISITPSFISQPFGPRLQLQSARDNRYVRIFRGGCFQHALIFELDRGQNMRSFPVIVIVVHWEPPFRSRFLFFFMFRICRPTTRKVFEDSTYQSHQTIH